MRRNRQACFPLAFSPSSTSRLSPLKIGEGEDAEVNHWDSDHEDMS